MDAFNTVMSGPNPVRVMRGDVRVDAADLLRIPDGAIPKRDCGKNIRVALHTSKPGRAAPAARAV